MIKPNDPCNISISESSVMFNLHSIAYDDDKEYQNLEQKNFVFFLFFPNPKMRFTKM